jgi:hypothetical protein
MQARPSLDALLEPGELGMLLGRRVAEVRREPYEPAGWSSTDAVFEGVYVDGEREPSLVAKTVRRDHDWVAVATDDTVDREVRCWESGLLDRLPQSMRHVVLGTARTDAGYSLLMREVSSWLVPNTAATPTPRRLHAVVLDALAAMHARFWLDDSLTDRWLGLASLAGFVGHTSPSSIEKVRHKGGTSEVLDFAEEGWRRLPMVTDPSFAADVEWLAEDPALVTRAAERWPWTLVHADPRSANAAIDDDGRLILLDWARPVVGLPTVDLACWLFGGNQHRAVSHTELIDLYARSLRAHLGPRLADDDWESLVALGLLAVFVPMAPFIARFQPEAATWWMERVRPELLALG